MARLFGTDGVRGLANEEMTAELAMSIGRAAAAVLTEGRRRRPLVVIGKDTRLSSDMLESGLAAGLCSVGADVIIVGVMPTPAVAYLVYHYKADAGIMISASHNPYPYNGIKIFSGDGFKLPDDLENRIEALVLDEPKSISLVKNELLGTMSYRKSAVDDYVEHLVSTVPTCLDGLHIAVDCANGSASATAAKLFAELKIEASTRTAALPTWRSCKDMWWSTGWTRAWPLTAMPTAACAWTKRARWWTATSLWPFARWT